MFAPILAQIVVKAKETREPVSVLLLVAIILALVGFVVLIARMGKRKDTTQGAGMHKPQSRLDDGAP